MSGGFLRSHIVFDDIKAELDKLERMSPAGKTIGQLLEGLLLGRYEYFNPWEDLRFPAQGVKLGLTNPPTWVNAGLGGGLLILEFSEIQSQDVFMFVQLPHAWKVGSKISPHIHTQNHNAGTGDVVWKLAYSFAIIGSVFPSSTEIEVVQTVDYAVNTHKLIHLPDITPPPSVGEGLSTMALFRLYRDTGDGRDDYTDGMGFMEFDIHYQKDSVGSDEEVVKNDIEDIII